MNRFILAFSLILAVLFFPVHAGGLGDTDNSKWLIDASWLYWRPDGGMKDYASIVELNNISGRVRPLAVDPGFKSGIGVNGQYVMANGVIDFGFNFAYFDQSYGDGPHYATNAIRTVEISNPVISGLIYDYAGGKVRYDYNSYEINTGYLLQLRQVLLRIIAGIHYAKIDSSRQALLGLNNGNTVTHTIAASTDAIGPVLGISFSYPIIQTINIFGSGKVGILAGKMDLESNLINSSGNPLFTANNAMRGRHSTIPYYEIRLAAEKTIALKEDNKFVLRAGFEGRNYEKSFIRRSARNSASEENIAFYGPFITVGVCG